MDAKNVIDAINKLFLQGNENKQTLVDNLIAMGIQASTDDTWGTLLDKVLDMTDTSNDTVTAATLLAGYTAHNASGMTPFPSSFLSSIIFSLLFYLFFCLQDCFQRPPHALDNFASKKELTDTVAQAVSGVYKFIGSVNFSELPTEGMKAGYTRPLKTIPHTDLIKQHF